MSLARKATILLALLMGLGVGTWAQFRGMGMQPPPMPGTFKPVVGSGARYQMQTKDLTMKFAYAVVGREDVGDNPGYWMEIRTEGAGLPGETVMKQLMVVQAGKAEIKRTIMQVAGRPPMEIPLGMMGGLAARGQQSSEKGDTSLGDKVGTENITVPAGTFECDHFRRQDGKIVVDYWISPQVALYGVVKMASAAMSMVLEKVLTNEVTHIKGEPEKPKLEMPHF